ncbi:hypothetical protein HMPREF9431_01109 [Segatella oulorum F0390]|uniref:Uncharacterized protein n=1 Tax=Segatella oulorum F0390 TaxID=702438 RepID=G1WBA8_9BACT|nr:hypothetical protein HMPREF9431_01109 [Segatella oulorum F0390]
MHRALHPNETVGANIRAQFSQAKCVGAAPMCPPERPRSGVSIPKMHALCAGILTMDAPLQGDAGGHTGTAPYQSPSNRTVCPYLITLYIR